MKLKKENCIKVFVIVFVVIIVLLIFIINVDFNKKDDLTNNNEVNITTTISSNTTIGTITRKTTTITSTTEKEIKTTNPIYTTSNSTTKKATTTKKTTKKTTTTTTAPLKISIKCPSDITIGDAGKCTLTSNRNINGVWKSSDNSIVKVSNDGTIKGVSYGSATISFISEEGHNVESYIYVNQLPVGKKIYNIGGEYPYEGNRYYKGTVNFELVSIEVRGSKYGDKIPVVYEITNNLEDSKYCNGTQYHISNPGQGIIINESINKFANNKTIALVNDEDSKYSLYFGESIKGEFYLEQSWLKEQNITNINNMQFYLTGSCFGKGARVFITDLINMSLE